MTYDSNTIQGGSGTPPAPTTSYSGGSAIQILNNLNFTATGKTFGGWNTSADGSGTNYGPGYTTTYAGGLSITLYAIWV